MSKTSALPTPYVGLIPYDEESADFFFGREAEEQIITSNLKASRLTLLYGASGVGKSSVLRAGVAYHLKKLAQQNMARRSKPKFVVVFFNSWRDDPIAGLTARIRDAVAETLNQPELEPPSPSLPLAEILREWGRRIQGSLLIILDQFEEYFLYHPNEEGEGTFAAQFPGAVNDSNVPANFLVSFREDAYAKLDFFKGRVNNLYENFLRVDHLDREAARGAIIEPIDHYNYLLESRSGASNGNRITIEPRLVETVLKQVESGRVVLGESGRGVVEAVTQEQAATIETPFLQLVMTRLWKEEMLEHSKVLRLETLERLKGAESIVRSHLDETMNALSEEKQAIAAAVFHYLVTPGGTKIAHTIPDLADYAKLPKANLRSTLEELASGETRILRVNEAPTDRPGEARYEIFHDVLAPAILDWRARYAQAEERAATDRRLEQEARQHALAVHQLARERSLAGRLRWALIGLMLLLLLMLGVTVWAKRQQTEAVKQRQSAETATAYANVQKKLALEATGRVTVERDNAAQARDEKERQRLAAENASEAANQAAQRAEEQRQIADAAKLDASDAEQTEKNTRLGLTEIRAGRLAEATTLLEETNKAYARRNDTSGQVFALASLGEAYANQGRVFSSTFIEALLQGSDPDEQELPVMFSGTDYSSFLASLLKNDAKSDKEKKEKEELATNQRKAAGYYEAALRVIESDKKVAPTNKALVLHRLGDIYAISSSSIFEQAEDSTEKSKNFQSGVGYYDRASEAYRIDGKPLEQANMLRHAAQFLAMEVNAERAAKDEEGFRKDLSASAEYFQRAADVFKQIRKGMKAAVMYSEIGELYQRAPEGELKKRDLAIKNYEAAATIFGENQRPELVAPLDSKIGQLYAELNKEDDAASYYGQAYLAYRQAESLVKETDKYSASKKEALNSIVDLYTDKDEKKNDEQKKKADEFFKQFVTEQDGQGRVSPFFIKDPVERASVLDLISKAYAQSHGIRKQDKRRALFYLELERDAWQQAKHLFEETRACFEILRIREELDDRETVANSFDQAIRLYQSIKPQLDPERLAQLTSRFQIDARYLSEHDLKPEAAVLYEELLELTLTPGAYPSQRKEAYSLLARLYIGRKDWVNADRVFQKVLTFYDTNRDERAATLADIGSLYAEAPDAREAAQTYYLQAALAELSLYPSLTQTYQKEDTLREAREALSKAGELAPLLQGQSQDAYLTAFAEAAQSASVPERLKEATAREVLGDYYYNFKPKTAEQALVPTIDKSKALVPFERAQSLYQDLNEKTSEARVLRKMSAVYGAMGGEDNKVKSKQLADQADRTLKPH